MAKATKPQEVLSGVDNLYTSFVTVGGIPQNITGNKTFSTPPSVASNPTSANQLVPKSYVDGNVGPVSYGRWITPTMSGVAQVSQTFTAGRVVLVQFEVVAICRIDGIAYIVGTTSAGNVIGGIVGPVNRTSDTANTGVVVAQSTSTPQGSTSAVQLLTWTGVTVNPGIYYAALEGDNATGTYMRQSSLAQAPGLSQFYDRGGGYGTLTDPTPTVTDTGTIVPGIRIRLG